MQGVLRATTTAMPEADNLDQVGEGLRALPNMNEFSPGVLGTNHIRQVLLTVRPHVGDREAMATAIEAYPRIAATTTDRNQRTQRAMNVLIGMSQCGLLQRDGRSILPVFTPVADTLLGCCSDAEADEMFARHILESCQGLELLDAVDMIRDRGEIPTLQAIREELRARGFDITENEGDASKLRQWLEASRIVDRSWEVDEHRLQAVVGAGSSTLAEWQGLTRGQRAFLQVLREQDRTVPGEWISTRHVKRLCESSHGRAIFPEGRLRDEVITPLAQAGWLEAQGERGGTAGRGGDSGDVRAASKLRDLRISLPAEAAVSIPADLRPRLSVPLEQIFVDLRSTDTGVKGLALELLALRIVRDIGLLPAGFRLRSGTAGTEVDLLAIGIHLHYSRWLFQCKNTASGITDVADIAKEAGMALVMRAHVIVMVTTGRFTPNVITFANELAKASPLQALLIDDTVLRHYRAREGRASLIDWLHAKAFQVLRLKAPQVGEVQRD